MKKQIYEINATGIEAAEPCDDLYQGRKNVIKSLENLNGMDSDVTILVQAYNRLDKTKECISSILKNTKKVNYDLLLLDNGSTDGTFEYFKTVEHDKVRIIHINKNISCGYPINHYNLNWMSKYFVSISNDIIVTPNWLSNMLRIADSDDRIGMVNPVSSNVSNRQMVNLEFSDFKEMQEKAAKYNISDKSKWHERLRLITLGTLYKKECLYTIGWPINDVGFFHDFMDDDITFRVRRTGYKAILARDTWIHHNHDVFNFENKNPENFKKSLDVGRKNFVDKYYGIDPWDDVNNFVFPYIEKKITPPSDKNNVKVLGIDVKCGTPILDIKNCLRTFNVIDPKLHAFTSDAKYYIDLKTICDDVVCDRHEYLINSFKETKFDYIIIGDSINSYKEPEQTIECAYSLLNDGGQLFISLKNTYNAITMLKMLGHSVGSDENILQIEFNSFYNSLKKRNMKIELINCQLYDLSDEIIDYCSNLIRYAKSNDCKEEDLLNKLRVDSYWFKITK